MGKQLKAPFPWFGGKSRVASLVWERFGNVKSYIEPFAGSLAVLLARPGGPAHVETVNDMDGYVANFWRAVQADPDEVARWADWPVDEVDLHARHTWLIEYKRHLASRLMADPHFCDLKIAGWWVWGIGAWIGNGWCTADGPWRNVSGELLRDQKPGISRRLPRFSGTGGGVHRVTVDTKEWLRELAKRLRRVRVACGDWERVVASKTVRGPEPTGIFLDPPYAGYEKVYGLEEQEPVSVRVRNWALENAGPRTKIALCGYEGEHEMPSDWECVPWKAVGGYGNLGQGQGRENASRERIWFSP